MTDTHAPLITFLDSLLREVFNGYVLGVVGEVLIEVNVLT